MKNFVIAAVIAVSSLVAFAPASYADTIVIKHERPMHRNWHPRPHHRCVVKTVKTWHHGRVVIKKTRICR